MAQWRSARARARKSTPEEMALEGRKPSFDSAGNIRGYRSRPGAPISPNDNMDSRSPLGVNGGFSNDATWANFFGGNTSAVPETPSVAGVTGGDKAAEFAANPMFDLAPTEPQDPMSMAGVLPTANQYLDNAIAGNETWLNDSENGTRAFVSPYGSGFSTTKKPKYVDTLARLAQPIDDLNFLD